MIFLLPSLSLRATHYTACVSLSIAKSNNVGDANLRRRRSRSQLNPAGDLNGVCWGEVQDDVARAASDHAIAMPNDPIRIQPRCAARVARSTHEHEGSRPIYSPCGHVVQVGRRRSSLLQALWLGRSGGDYLKTQGFVKKAQKMMHEASKVAEPSPTTGTFAMPLILNNGGLVALGSPKDSSKGCVSEDGSSPYFEFRPHIRLSSRPGLSSLAPLGSLGLSSKQQEFAEKNQSLCETNGSSSSQVVKTESIAQSSPESTWSVTASGSPVEVFTLKANVFSEDASNELQLTKDPDCRIQASLSDPNGSEPLNAAEKSTEDGYNWRKYGQKHVKGSEFPRSYYKCTHPNCQMKKQLERSHDGHITEIIYKGQHDHPKPQASRRAAVGGIYPGQEEEKEDGLSSLANFEEKFSNAPCHASHVNPNCNSELSPVSVSDDEVEVAGRQSGLGGDEAGAADDPESKRRKMEVASIDANSIAKNNREPRVVVQTVSEVDILDDGYRWRKYGQKVVKGNPNPRSYYKCTNPGCSVRKHVERASHDPKAVITTYEGKHNHDVPAAKTSSNSNRESSPPLITDGNIPRTYIPHHYSQPEENNAINLHLGVGVGSNHNSLLNEKHHLSGLDRIPSHHHHLQYMSSDCNNVMIQLNPVSKLYGSSNNAVFGSRDNKGEGFSFSTQMNNSSSHYYPRADNLVMGP